MKIPCPAKVKVACLTEHKEGHQTMQKLLVSFFFSSFISVVTISVKLFEGNIWLTFLFSIFFSSSFAYLFIILLKIIRKLELDK